MTTKAVSLFLCGILMPFFCSASSATTLEECMKSALDGLRQPTTLTIFHDHGCTTGGTEFKVSLNYTGFKVDECRAELCWPAPPGRKIVDATMKPGSAAGSRHDVSGPVYKPNREQALEVCYDVYARGPDKDIGARGWAKVEATATTENILTPEQAITAATECEKQLKQPGQK